MDTVLTEEYTFGSSLNSGRAKGAKFYPIKTDDDGLDPEDLEAVLAGWDEASKGRKPHVLYTIPCGQVRWCCNVGSFANEAESNRLDTASRALRCHLQNLSKTRYYYVSTPYIILATANHFLSMEDDPYYRRLILILVRSAC